MCLFCSNLSYLAVPHDYRWLVALSTSSMVHLRDEHELRRELAGVLSEEELDELEASDNRCVDVRLCMCVCLRTFAHICVLHLQAHFLYAAMSNACSGSVQGAPAPFN